jgi:hypothetical protein
MLPGGEDIAIHFEVQVIGRAIVHDLNVRVGQQLVIVAVGLRNRELIGLPLSEVLPPLGDGGDFDVAEPAKGLNVRRANETSADDACFDSLHDGWFVDWRRDQDQRDLQD